MSRYDVQTFFVLFFFLICGIIAIRLYQLNVSSLLEVVGSMLPFFCGIVIYIIIKRVIKKDAHR